MLCGKSYKWVDRTCLPKIMANQIDVNYAIMLHASFFSLNLRVVVSNFARCCIRLNEILVIRLDFEVCYENRLWDLCSGGVDGTTSEKKNTRVWCCRKHDIIALNLAMFPKRPRKVHYWIELYTDRPCVCQFFILCCSCLTGNDIVTGIWLLCAVLLGQINAFPEGKHVMGRCFV